MKNQKLTVIEKAKLILLAKAGNTLARAILDGFNNRVIEGLWGSAATTPSAQLTGNGNTTWNINLEKGLAVVAGVVKDFAASVDLEIHSGSELMDSGQECIAAIVAKNVGGTVSLVAVKGTVAADGAAVGPSDATIQAAVGAGNAWVKVLETKLRRTADTTVAQTYDHSKRDFGPTFNA